jgi:hypothetical protein
MKQHFLRTAAAAVALLASSLSFGAVVYTSTSTTGLNVSTATRPMALDDISFAAATVAPQQLTALTFGVGVLPNTTAQSATVFIDFYDTFTPGSATSVVSDYIGGFGGTLTVTANTSTTTTALRSFTFSTLATLSPPIIFNDNNVAIVITLADAAGTAYSSVLTPLMTTGALALGSSITGVYRDTNVDGSFQSTELNAALGNLYLSLTTTPVPEAGTWALMGLGLAAIAVVRRRRA